MGSKMENGMENGSSAVGGFLLTSLIVFLLISLPVSALSEQALEMQKEISAAESVTADMRDAGFNTVRYNDTLLVARELYRMQVELEKENKTTDYSRVKNKLAELSDLESSAYKTADELKAVEMTAAEIIGVNKDGWEPALELLARAQDEFESERYEKSQKYIEQTYDKLSELEAAGTKLTAFYEATSRTLSNFFLTWWKHMAAGAAAIIIIIIFTHSRITRWNIKRHIEYLKKRKETIRKLIATTQKTYFEKGRMDEGTYHTRADKYGELIRDINRQIPVLEEDLTKEKEKNISDVISGKIRGKIKKRNIKIKKPEFISLLKKKINKIMKKIKYK